MSNVRVVTLNIWQEQGPWQERLRLCEQQLAAIGPDVLCLQEVRQVPGRIPNQAQTLATALSLEHVYETAQPWGGGDEGLAILSRFPIVARDVLELPTAPERIRRICLGAELDTPWGRCWIFTTHLAYRLQDGALRERQVRAVDNLVRQRRGDLASIVCGDFNATPDADEIRYLRGLTSLEGERTFYQDAFATCNPGVAGLTWTAENPYKQTMHWFPDRRLDYIFVSPERKKGGGRVHASRIVCDAPDAQGVRCSDHYGVLAEVQLADAAE